MSQLFYDHLININRLKAKIDELHLTKTELRELEQHLHELIEHRIVEIILDNLHHDHHHIFIEKLENMPHDPELLKWIKEQVHDIEHQISDNIEQLQSELLQELFLGSKYNP